MNHYCSGRQLTRVTRTAERPDPEEILQNFAHLYIGRLADSVLAKRVSVFKPKTNQVYREQFEQLERHLNKVLRGIQNLVTYRVYCLVGIPTTLFRKMWICVIISRKTVSN